jgi:hypothetical protein
MTKKPCDTQVRPLTAACFKTQTKTMETLEVTFVNQHGETMRLKKNKDGMFFHHNDCMEGDKFIPLSKANFFLDNSEQKVISAFLDVATTLK